MATMYSTRTRRHVGFRSTFIVEVLLLLAMLLMTLALVMGLYASANIMEDEATRTEDAIVLASDAAERFAALDDPLKMPVEEQSGDYLIRSIVDQEATTDGVIYKSDIEVIHGEDVLYTLSTARFVSMNGGK